MPLNQDWVRFAQDDLEMAKFAMQSSIWNQVCFHSQQAVEKLLKATMASENIPRTHKLVDLLSLTNAEMPSRLIDSIRLLDRFYIPVRYPDALPGSIEDNLPNQHEAEDALHTAQQLWNHLV